MSNYIVAFDTETSGLPDWKVPSDSPHQPHIVSLAAGLFDFEKKEMLQSIDLIIKPDGWKIEQETIDIHGITNELANDVGVVEPLAVQMFIDLLGNKLRVAHNTTFDNRIIRIALKRFFSNEVADEFKEEPYYCTMVNSSKILGGKWPKLGDVYQRLFDVPLEGTHSAYADMEACAHVYFELQDLVKKQEEGVI